MPFKTVYHSDFYKIDVDLEGNLVFSEWLRPVTADELIAGATKLYEALRETDVERALANAQILSAVNGTAKDWMANEFYELLSQTNLKQLARVMPASVFHQLALESVVTRAEALGKVRFEVKNFNNPADALSWLSE